MVPVELKAYFRDGVELRVDGLPKLNSDAFTMNKLGDQPVSSRQMINGVALRRFTWPTVITAVKAGDYEMSVELPTTVTVRQQGQRPRSRRGNPFGDDFFDDVFNNFFGTATQKQIALNSEPGGGEDSVAPDRKPAGQFHRRGRSIRLHRRNHAHANRRRRPGDAQTQDQRCGQL